MEMEPTVENSKDLTITKAFVSNLIPSLKFHKLTLCSLCCKQITSASVINQNDEDGDPNGFSINVSTARL